MFALHLSHFPSSLVSLTSSLDRLALALVLLGSRVVPTCPALSTRSYLFVSHQEKSTLFPRDTYFVL